MKKVFATLVAITFLSGQLVYAQDLNNLPQQDPLTSQPAVAPNDLVASQSFAEGVIQTQQAIETEGYTPTGNITSQQFDYLGRLFKTFYDTNEFTITTYWGLTAKMFRETTFTNTWSWRGTTQFKSTDGTTLAFEWFADLNPETSGDETYREFDSLGRLSRTNFDNGDYALVLYWTESDPEAKEQNFYNQSGALYKKVAYDIDGEESMEYLYDSHSRVTTTTDLVTGDYIATSYWNTTDPEKKTEEFYHSTGPMYKKAEYQADGITQNYEWLYDSLSRTTKYTISTTGVYTTYTYFGTTAYKYQVGTYGVGGVWQQTLEYFDNPNNTKTHYKWVADANPGTNGDKVYFEYTLVSGNSRLIKWMLDTGDYTTRDYYGTTSIPYHDINYTSADAWIETFEYYNQAQTGEVYKWSFPDPDTGASGDITSYEYDQTGTGTPRVLGRITRTNYDNGDYILTTYWNSADPQKQYNDFYHSTGGKYRRLQYQADGATIDYEWLYDSLNRPTKYTICTTGLYYSYEYWGSTTTLFKKYFNDGTDGALTKIEEYYENGTTVHKLWVPDLNIPLGDAIYFEYDTSARVTRKDFDDGKKEEYCYSANESLVYINGLPTWNLIYDAGQVFGQNLQNGYTAIVSGGKLYVMDPNGVLVGHDYGGFNNANNLYFDMPDGYSNEEWFGLIEWGGPTEGENPIPRTAYNSMHTLYDSITAPRAAYASNRADRPQVGTVISDGATLDYNALGYYCGAGGGVTYSVNTNAEMVFTWNNPTSGLDKWYATNPGTDAAPFNASSCPYLMIRIKGAAGGGPIQVQIQDKFKKAASQAIVSLGTYGALTTSYQDIYIPLGDFVAAAGGSANCDLSNLFSVVLLFRDQTSGSQTVYIDQIKIISEASAATLAKSVSTGTVKIQNRRLYVGGSDFEIKGVGYAPYNSAYYNRDMALIQEMGANTIRTWGKVDQALLDAAAAHGIKVSAGFWIDYNTDLSVTANRNAIKTEFINYVNQFKGHSALLIWTLGNENNLQNQAGGIANFYSLCNELGQIAYVEEGATYHPVSIVNGGPGNIGSSGLNAADSNLTYIDMWGCNLYHGQSFVNSQDYFNYFESKTDKPFYFTEYGIDAWHSNDLDDPSDGYEDAATQAAWDVSAATEIYNSEVALGGCVFMFADGWSKAATNNYIQFRSGPGMFTRKTDEHGVVHYYDTAGNLIW
jgi:hypothetical protein